MEAGNRRECTLPEVGGGFSCVVKGGRALGKGGCREDAVLTMQRVGRGGGAHPGWRSREGWRSDAGPCLR